MVPSIDRNIARFLRWLVQGNALPIRCLGLLLGSSSIAPAIMAQNADQGVLGSTRFRVGTPAVSQAPDRVWIESLIEIGAADLAAQVSQSRLKECVPDSNAHAQWLMLHLQAKTAQAVDRIDWNSPLSPLQAAVEQLGKSESGATLQVAGPRGPWIQWQQLWCRRLIHQNSLAAFLAVPGRKPLQEWTLQSIREGLDQIDSLEQTVLKLQPDKPIVSKVQRELKDKTLPNEITSGEILDLRGEIELLRADFLYQRSQCYPEGSDERIAAASQMLTSLDRAASQLPANWTHRPLLTLARAEAELQLSRHRVVQQNMEQLWNSLADASNPEVRGWRITAASLAIRSARLTQDWKLADAWFARAGGWENSPELAIEHLAITVARDLNRSASPESILGLRKIISQRFGRYWEQRVDAMLVSNPLLSSKEPVTTTEPVSGGSMASLELFRIQARQAIAANQIETAIEKLQQAESTASKLGAVPEAFGFAMQIGALLQRLGQDSAAADEFYRTAISYPESPKASAAAMMSAWLIRLPDAKLDADAQEIRQATYIQRLRETAILWPQSESAQQAIQNLETIWLNSGDFDRCLDFWREYLNKNPQSLARALRRLLLVDLISQEDWLEKSIQDPAVLGKSREKLIEGLREAIGTSQQTGESKLEQVDLNAWLEATSSLRRWKQDVPKDRIGMFLDKESNGADALGQLADAWHRCEDAWQKGSVDQALIDGLENANQGWTKSGGVRFANGRLERSLDLLKIEVGSKTPQELQGKLEQRIAKEPKSLWWVYRAARTMQRTGSLFDPALGWYRQMAAGVVAGSPPWLEARARTIGILQAKGDSAKADELRSLLLASYPNLSEEWKARIAGR